MIAARKVKGWKKSGYGRLEEGMVWRLSTGREDYGRWKDLRIYLELPYACTLHGVTASCIVELVGVCWVHVSRDCVTSVRSYSHPPPTTWERQ